EPSRGRKQRVKARFGGELIHSDTLDLHDATARAKLAKVLVAKVGPKFGDGALAVADVERELLATVESREAAAAEAGEAEAAEAREAADPGGYKACLDDDPETHGLYRLGTNGPVRVANFTLTIERDVLVHDDQQDERRFEGTVRLDGADHPFA